LNYKRTTYYRLISYRMDKKLFLLIFLTSCFAVAQAQQSDTTIISNPNVSDSSVIERTVSQDTTAVPPIGTDSTEVAATEVAVDDQNASNQMARLPLDSAQTTVPPVDKEAPKIAIAGSIGGSYMSGLFIPDPEAPAGSTWTIIDSRDNKEYRVRKMPDGRIWMTQDLRYGGPDGSACEKLSFSGSTSENVNSNRFGEGTYGDCRNNPAVANAGYLYDWAAAMQHPDAYYGNDAYVGCSGTTPMVNACKGICPEGFHVPTHAEFIDANDMFSGTNDGKWNASSEWQGVLGGWCNNTGTISSQGSEAYYWSSTQALASFAYNLSFGSGYVAPEYYNTKYTGFSVRCVKNSPGTFSQTFDPDPDAPEGSTWTIIDSRDTKEYKVRKMADGRIWMIQDLRYGGPGGNACEKSSFSGSTLENINSNRFGTGTFGDCRNNPTVANAGYLYDWAAAVQHPEAYYLGSYAGIDGTKISTAWVRGICPEGFHIPTRVEFVDANTMFKGTNDDKWNTSSQWQGVFGGWCNSADSLSQQGSGAYYWSSTPLSNSVAYTLHFESGGYVNPENLNGNKDRGLSLRCVKDQPVLSEDFNPEPDAPVGAIWAIIDSRDDKKYTTRKMADGRIWMTQDLRYGGPDGTACDKSSFSGSISENVNSNRFGKGTFGDCRNNASVANAGYLYDWTAAMQQPDAYYGNDTYAGCSGLTSSNNICKGLCPEGFHVPTKDEFVDANGKFPRGNDNKWNSTSTWQGVLGGVCYSDGSLDHQGTRAHYWSSTQERRLYAYSLSFESGKVNPQFENFKYHGASLRCVKDPDPLLSEDFNPDPKAPVGTTWTMIDSRDDKKYKVRKMADGRIWMIQDLRYGGTKDACVNRKEFIHGVSAEAIATNRFGEGTYGDCRNNTQKNAGYLYNWAAAMQHANAYTGKSYTGCSGTGSSANSCSGLCPKKFHVPTKDEFVYANSKFPGTKDEKWSLEFNWQGVLGGYCYDDGSLTNQGNLGWYWSSTQHDDKHTYSLLFYNGHANPKLNNTKHYGRSLRCVMNY
jgi:uncharacterized protein (TIGR02145 family)